MFCNKKDEEIKQLKEEVARLTNELRREKERQKKKKIGYREKCLKKAVEMAKELGVDVSPSIKI